MAHAIAANRPHRASGDLALHVLEVMQAVEQAGEHGSVIDIETRPERPAMLPVDLVPGTLD